MVDRLGHIGEEGRVAVAVAADETANLCAASDRSHSTQKAPALKVVALRIAVEGKEVVPVPDGIATEIFGATDGIGVGCPARMLGVELNPYSDPGHGYLRSSMRASRYAAVRSYRSVRG